MISFYYIISSYYIMKKYNKSLFIFRKDYRLYDNTALIASLQKSKTVIPVFIFTPEQLIKNEYKSNNCIQFMIESLTDLDNELRQNTNSRLFYFFGEPSKIIKKILESLVIDAIFTNRDYTPYSKNRDENINNICLINKIDFVQYEDCLLNNVGKIKNSSGNIYVKFTPYFNTAKKSKIRDPIKNNHKNFYPKRNKINNEFI